MGLRRISKEELKDILTLHELWLNKSPGGVKADLKYADLSFTELSGSNLSRADLRYSDFSGSSFGHSNLSYSDLSHSNFYGVIFDHSNLSYSDLRYSNFACSRFNGSNLFCSDVRFSNLEHATLLKDRLLPLTKATLSIVPQSGIFTGWKKVVDLRNKREWLLELEIIGARVNAIGSRKCRASEVKVISANVLGEDEGCFPPTFTAMRNAAFIYEIGKTYKVDNFNDDIREECGAGIHFFITRKEAEVFRL